MSDCALNIIAEHTYTLRMNFQMKLNNLRYKPKSCNLIMVSSHNIDRTYTYHKITFSSILSIYFLYPKQLLLLLLLGKEIVSDYPLRGIESEWEEKEFIETRKSPPQ